MKKIDRLVLEHIMQTGGEGAQPLFKDNYKWEFPPEWNRVVPATLNQVPLNDITLHGRLLRAVRVAVERTRGRSVAVLLSGGVDSVSLLRYLDQFFPETNVVAYHTNWHYTPRSEVRHAQKAAAFCGVDLKIVDVSPKTQVPFIEDALRKTKTVDYSIIAAYMAFNQMKEDGIDVAFNALGLDEYLSGYPIHRRLYDRMGSRLPKFVPPINSTRREIRWVMRKVGNDKAFFYFNTLINPYMRLARADGPEGGPMADDFYSDVKQNNLWNTVQLHLAKGMFHNHATNIRRAAMSVGVEIDFPYMNYDLAHYCFGIPPLQKYNKEPLRRVMEKVLMLPSSLSERGWNWHAGADWDKFAWGGTIEPYLGSPEFMQAIRPERSELTYRHRWFTRDAIVKFWTYGHKKPSRVYIQMLLFLKLLELMA